MCCVFSVPFCSSISSVLSGYNIRKRGSLLSTYRVYVYPSFVGFGLDSLETVEEAMNLDHLRGLVLQSSYAASDFAKWTVLFCSITSCLVRERPSNRGSLVSTSRFHVYPNLIGLPLKKSGEGDGFRPAWPRVAVFLCSCTFRQTVWAHAESSLNLLLVLFAGEYSLCTVFSRSCHLPTGSILSVCVG